MKSVSISKVHKEGTSKAGAPYSFDLFYAVIPTIQGNFTIEIKPVDRTSAALLSKYLDMREGGDK